jgi:VanZ family protein
LNPPFPPRRLWRVALVALLAVVTWLALVPKPPPQLDFGWDKVNHIAAFAALAAVATPAFPGRRGRIVAALMMYGVLIEVAQSFIPLRSGDWRDLVGDAIGIALGLVLAAAIAWLHTPPQSRGDHS